MASIAQQITTHLLATPAVMTLLPGGVWTRPLQPNVNPPGTDPTPGSTPAAFDALGFVQRAVYVKSGTVGENRWGPPAAFDRYPQLMLYGHDRGTERDYLQATVMEVLYTALEGLHLNGPFGTSLRLKVTGCSDTIEPPELPESVLIIVNLQASGVWGVNT